jgi:aminopeptidase N
VLADPGPQSMFDDRVYKRGALTLHALRRAAGDSPFFDLLRSWCEQNQHGTVSTGMFSAHVHECVGSGPSALLDAWLFKAPLPPREQTVGPGTGPTVIA